MRAVVNAGLEARVEVVARAREVRYIAVEGPIGVGKTALAAALAEEYSALRVTEPLEDNPFLPRFYEDPDRYALTAQLSFLV